MSKVGIAACVYNIWYERNLRLFQDGKRDVNALVQAVKKEIKWKLISLNVKKTKDVIHTYKKWDIDIQVLKTHH